MGSRPMFEVLASRSPALLALRRSRALDALDREWSSVVGRKLGARTFLSSIEGDVLVVGADSQSSAIDFGFKKNAVLRVLREELRMQISDIKIEVRRRPPRASRPERMSRAPRASIGSESEVDEETARIMHETEGIDAELARAIARCKVASRSVK